MVKGEQEETKKRRGKKEEKKGEENGSMKRGNYPGKVGEERKGRDKEGGGRNVE